jgi:hypothetical protein
MRIRTLLGYLIGRRQAILDIAGDGRALILGFLFVLSAGLAREYDGADLVHEPWHLLIPIAASLGTSFLLFCITFGVFRTKQMGAPPFLTSYKMFLSLFWMTAPLAWLYGIPYERFLSPVAATTANLWTLGLVAAWRVTLMIRVVSVLMGYRIREAIFLVLVLADAEALVALWLSPIPLIDVMGGIRGSESEMMRKGLALSLAFYGGCSMPIWLIGAFVLGLESRPRWQGPAMPVAGSRSWSYALHALVWASLALWFVFLPFTQPEQILRRQVERKLKEGRISEALMEMSAHNSADFPPQWDPPPKPASGQSLPPLLDIMEVVLENPPAPWVRSIYLEKLRRYLLSWYSQNEPERLAQLLMRLPERESLLDALAKDGRDYFRDQLRQEITKLQEGDKTRPPK